MTDINQIRGQIHGQVSDQADAPTNEGERFVAEYRANATALQAAGAYDPAWEHDACGVGMVAAIDGQPTREVVAAGISALKAVWHRGAVDADGKTGDGAGICVQIPQNFFKEHIRRTGHEPGAGRLAVGMVFLPRTDIGAQERCRVIVESEIIKAGHTIYGWRQVPINTDVIGEKANATRPEIEQIMIENRRGVPNKEFELDLYKIRRRIEKAALVENLTELYICSLSCRSVVYKGMFLAEQIDVFYPDLLDERFVSNFAVYHQRYSTNTFPTWRLAQPFRTLAHNGEINTLKGNVNWMRCHEVAMGHELFGQEIEDILPVIQPGSSDSAALDAVVEVMLRAGRWLPMVKTMLIPEAWRNEDDMPEAWRDMYKYCNTVMEPWDGPAAICAYGGRWALAGLDRNGLRPLRYVITGNGLLIAGSEAGMVPVDEGSVVEKGRLGPGEMIAVNLDEGKLFRDKELKDYLAGLAPFGEWVGDIDPVDDHMAEFPDLGGAHGLDGPYSKEELRRRQFAAGYTLEELELILQPMGAEGKEATGSMGDDVPIAVLSGRYRPMHHFFKQNFSQVTNPPIDSLRETRVMSLTTRLGNLGNILDEDPSQCRIVQLDSPVLTNAAYRWLRDHMGEQAVEIDCTFDPAGEPRADGRRGPADSALRDAVIRIQQAAEDAVRGGPVHLVLTDEKAGPERAPIPMILATGAVHTHLVKQHLRTYTSITVRSSECLDVHHYAVLIGVGGTLVNAYLAEESLADRHRRDLFGDMPYGEVIANYRTAVDKGLLKIMSKMGISVISSYRGGGNFEAIGLSRTLVAEFFPSMVSRISGIGLSGLQKLALEVHEKAWSEDFVALPVGGFYRFRRGGEAHAFQGPQIHMLQQACASESYSLYKKYSQQVYDQPPIHIRDLLAFNPLGAPVNVDEVESITSLRKRLVAPGISLGALSPEAHETLSIAMNRMGAKSDSGEGGEDPARYKPRPNGDNASSAIKQVASGRFGVTTEYLNNCRELEIKIAQGAKPGEGGQLPGFKVSEMIAKLRHSTPGVTLISPPPHHDIYSIEDLAQLIYDLKQINPHARVTVKLVSQTGIGTVAAGVAKAFADCILISGHSGGTGASPQTSIKYAGLPWELGLSEVHQVLMLNRLRHRVVLRVDGGIKTGRDVVKAAMLGGEEFGIGTTALVAMGCIMVRQCHSNTCPVGVCTQDESLRGKFVGTPEKVVNLFTFVAEEVRDILAELGARNLTDVIGRTDLLSQVSRGAAHLDDLDCNPLLAKAETGSQKPYCTIEGRNEVPDTLDATVIQEAAPLFERREKMQVAYNIRNVQRAIGTRTSHHIYKHFGMDGLRPGHLTMRLRGSAGQSLGAFGVQGLKIQVFGDANDYVGKGLSGATIVVRPLTKSPLQSNENTIIGNTVLYGATAGKLFAAGQAGERFCVRNSGATAVVEGCGSNGCEYMTGGTAVILGAVGPNFAAGMTGGMAFVYDPDSILPTKINPDTVIWERIQVEHWEGRLRAMIEEHAHETGSRFADRLLNDWFRERDHFWQVVPTEMLHRLPHPIRLESRERAG